MGTEYNAIPSKTKSAAHMLKLTQRLLRSSPTGHRPNFPLRSFEKILAETRTNVHLLRMLQLSPEEARNMFILPPVLLKDVHLAIMHFSKKENFHGIVLPVNEQPSQVSSGDIWQEGHAATPKESTNDKSIFAKHNQKVPGPIICTRLLELIGIPNYYRHISLSSLPNASATAGHVPTTPVHSSQVDLILECCLETNIALSRSCETGKHSLIGSDFNTSIPATAEDIWRSVWNLEIKYTSGKRESSHASSTMHHLHQPIRIGRIGSIGANYNPVVDYLAASQTPLKQEGEDDGEFYYNDEQLSGTTSMPLESESEARMPWSPKDKRRYDQSVILFNSALATYSKLSSSSSGVRHEVRREMVQNAERLLLEVASKGMAGSQHPSPSTILQCLQPDTISFNTAIKAWSEFSPRETRKHTRGHASDGDGPSDEGSTHMATATAERTKSILEMMQDLWDKERSNRSTLQSLQAAWEDNGLDVPEQHAPPPSRAIAPNASSYNGVLKAWSRSSDPVAAVRALKTFQTMIERNNVTSFARESLMLQNSEPVDSRSYREGAFPDSRTFVLLLQSLHNLSLSIGFRDAVDAVESIFHCVKQLDEQIHWSVDNGIAPISHLNDRGKPKPILNVFSYNTLIKTFSNLPTNWDESYQCCLRIDKIIEEMECDTSPVIPNAVTAWIKCADKAGNNKERIQLCVEKAGSYIDALLEDSIQSKGGNDNLWGFYLIQAINDTISLYGRVGECNKADELFLRARECNTHNLGTLSTIIDTLSENGSDDIAHVEKAQRYLLDFEQDKMRMSRTFIVPDMKFTSMYNSVISGFINCDMKERGLEQAQALLSHMVSSHESNPRHIARPNTTSFARVMSALAGRGQNTQRLEELLSKMEEMHERWKNTPRSSPDAELVANVSLNIVIYNLLLKAYARCNDDEAVQSAMKLLGRIETSPGISPDDISNFYIEALLSRKHGAGAKVPTSSSEKDKLVGPSLTKLDIDNLNLDDLNLIGQSKEPTSKSFNSIMNGTVEGAEKGAALLRKLEAMHSSGEIPFKPDIYLYNKLMNAWQLCEKSNSSHTISPAEKAQEILDSICEQCEEEGEGGLSPNEVSFSICIHSWCRSNRPDAPERAEQLLRRKEVFGKTHSGVKIKSTDYNSVISKWKDSPTNGSERATLLFEEMLQRYGDSEERMEPTSATLNALLDVYAKCDERNLAEKAEKILIRMNQLHKEGKGCIMPDIISYRTVIDAWVRSWHKDSPQKVDALVKEMIEKYKHEGRSDLRPDSNSLNLVLKACSHTPAMWKEKDNSEKGNDHPIAIANRTFSMLKGKNEYGASATHATYSFMFLCYRHHMDFRDKRFPSVMRNLWKHCCMDGSVSQFSLSAFRDSVLEPDFWKAIGGKAKFERLGKTRAEDIAVKDLPKEWSRNVSPLKNRGRKSDNK
ncbi:hypothetical protein ACHAXR_008087 [Thalassiosira sp. AJA248-18]